MSYELAVEYLYSLQKYGISSGSPRLPVSSRPLAIHRGQRYVHIAGTTQGIGAAMVESILRTRA